MGACRSVSRGTRHATSGIQRSLRSSPSVLYVTNLTPNSKDTPFGNAPLFSPMADSPKTPPTTVTTATLVDIPEMLEFIQRLGPVMDLDPDQLPPRLRALLEQDDEVDLSPRELADLLKETNLPEETMREVSALAEEAEDARAWEKKAQELLKQAVELAESVKKSRAQNVEAAPSTTPSTNGAASQE